MGDRPSSDVDLFTDWQLRADFPAAVDAVVAALEQHDYTVQILARTDTFARLVVALGEGLDGAIWPTSVPAAQPPRTRLVRSQVRDRLHPTRRTPNQPPQHRPAQQAD